MNTSMRETPEDFLAGVKETRATGSPPMAMDSSTGMDAETECLAEDVQDIPANCVSLWMEISTWWNQREEIKARRAELRHLIAVITKELNELPEPTDEVARVYKIGMQTRLKTLHDGVRRSWRDQSEVENHLLTLLYPWIRSNLAAIRQARRTYRTPAAAAAPMKGGDEHGENDDEEVAQGAD